VKRRLYLVTGGAGFLGINLCRHLLARGQAVRSLDIAPFDYAERTQVEAVTGDVRDRATVDAAMAGVDVVVHAAAALPLSSDEEIFTTDVVGTGIVLDSAFAHGVARFIFISSSSVYGIPDHHPLRENDPLRGVGPYGRAKVDAERLCLCHRARGHCVSILRPKTFVGPERLGIFELLYDWAFEGRAFPVLGRGDNRYQLLDVDDLCDAIGRCADLDRTVVNDTFNVGAQRFGSMRENVQAVLDRAGHGRRVRCVPVRPVVAALRMLEAVGLSPIYPWIYDTAAKDSIVAIDRLQSRLGFTPHYSNRDALLRNYDWYVAHRDEYRGRTGVSHRLPWRKGALALARHLF
jgi:nucleoside-diphosphate-sugar epimerase